LAGTTTHLRVVLLTITSMLTISGALGAQQELTPVVVTSARQTPLFKEVFLTGSVVAPRIAQLSTEVSGIVNVINFDIGKQVEIGEELLQLNLELASISLAASVAESEQAMKELEDARRRLEVARSLKMSSSVSANEIDSLDAEVAIDRAGVDRYLAEQRMQAAHLRRHTLYAPFTGTISRKLVELGEWVQPGEAVAELVATTELRIDFQVPQAYYPGLTGNPVIEVTLDAFPGRNLPSRIESVVPVADPVSRTFPVRVQLADPDLPLIQGMSASAVLKLDSGARGIVVPRDAVVRHADGRVMVWVVGKEGEPATVSERRVKVGPGFNGEIPIMQGLDANELVVVRGNEALRDGQAVSIRHLE